MPTLAHKPKAPPFPSVEAWSAFTEGDEVGVAAKEIEVDLEVAVAVMKAFIGSVCRLDRSEDAHRICSPYAVSELEECIFTQSPGPADAHVY
jgi:hypothetical protein